MTTYINNVSGVIEISNLETMAFKTYYGAGGTSGKFYPMKNHKYLIQIGGDEYEVLWSDLNLNNGTTPITYKDAGRLLGEIFTTGTTTSPIISATQIKVDINELFEIPEDADFTIEWFMYMDGDAYYPRVFSIGAHPGADNAVSIEGGSMLWWANSGVRLQTDTLPDLLFKWHHVAIVRNSGVVTIYFDGITLVSDTYADFIACRSDLYIGSENVVNTYFDGKMSNFRWTLGLPVYTKNFTPPTSPLQALEGTTLLILQGNNFDDEITDVSGFDNGVSYLNVQYSEVNPFKGYTGSILFGNY